MPSNVCPVPFIIEPPDDLLSKYPEIKRNGNTLAMNYAFNRLVEEKDLKIVGEQLWQALDLNEAFAAACAAAGRQILPLVVRSAQPALLQLPWETLYHPEHGFLGLHPAFTLSRNFGRPAPDGEHSPPTAGPLRILLFTSLPDNVDQENSRLDVEREQAEVQAALMPWILDGTAKLEMPDDGRLETLKEYLKKFDPHLLFLSGHGKFFGDPHQDKHYAEFVFEDEYGRAEGVHEKELAEAFVGSNVRAVVLSACESGMSASDALNVGLANRLSRFVPHVIGMRESILDEAGIQFARAVADAVATGERLDVALQTARKMITKPLKGRAIFRREGEATDLSELSFGQWCLPMLLTADPALPLLDDWNFVRQAPTARPAAESLQGIVLPPEFSGRRSELRTLKSRLLSGKLRRLLITGPGGQGKTALAGKLARDMQAAGFAVLAWAARPENDWDEFLFDLELSLNEYDAKKYDRVKARYKDDLVKQAHYLLGFLLNRHKGKLLLFFDNLESVQDPESLTLTDANFSAWIEAAQSLGEKGLTLLLTSRWKLPEWSEAEHHALRHPLYGDFLRMVRNEKLPPEFSKERYRLWRLYDTLHGNGRGLTFFASAVRGMTAVEEEAFLNKLAEVSAESQTDMALDTVISHLPAEARTLLERLPAYRTPAPKEGVFVLAPDLPEPAALLSRLTDVSLVEYYDEPTWQCREYQVHPRVTDWLEKNAPQLNIRWLKVAARYRRYLFDWERPTLNQAFIVHAALQRAEQTDEADRFALDYIVGKLNLAGLYRTLLSDWLPPICQSEDNFTRAEALGQTGKQNLHIGDYDTALKYLQQSLQIRQDIGDKQGEGTTLNNISLIYQARGDYETALKYLQQSLQIRQDIGNKEGEGTTLNNISLIYDARGDYETALKYLEQSLQICQDIGDKKGEGATLNNLATTSYARGDYDTALKYLQQSLQIKSEPAGEASVSALKYLQQSLQIQQDIGDKQGEGKTLNNISQIYDARGDYDTALKYLQQSLQISQDIGDKQGEGATLNNLATTSYARGDYDTALKYLQQSLQICQDIGDKQVEGTTLNNISQIYQARGDYDTSLKYLQQSLQISQDIGDASGVCNSLFNMGHIHWQNGEQQEAVSAWVTVYKLAKKINLAEALNALAGLAEQLGLTGGLQAWEELAKKMDEGASGENGD
ncbi:Tetratricopeptide TPR_2 repeat protein [Chloroherpeton thalassium ATCC 35110]|uniref:Tetratricopeptide TPR_2 repeat protein n=1 Tax=Chloroherpeton thalassium (strain ATCC 35110 / GB-78) TaxID=517418 RepID=B3QU53_CHLT3|nr:tetratricopeptide repeat protein [Chloroherpeton thalassium]ACF12851.1 Tetratricopeptide TPR_2 repeat protein [Chloroherpeton thalassium ATCC 35110]